MAKAKNSVQNLGIPASKTQKNGEQARTNIFKTIVRSIESYGVLTGAVANIIAAIFLAIAGAIFLAIVGFAAIFFSQGPQSSPTTLSPTLTPIIGAAYGFEDGDMDWGPRIGSAGSQACTSVTQSDKEAKEGKFSLRMNMVLVGGDPKKGRGEAWVDMRSHLPSGEPIQFPIDLRGRTVTAWIYAPEGSMGDPAHPNGFQLYVRDKNPNNLNNEYGNWYKILAENRWFQIALTVNDYGPMTPTPIGGYFVSEGFDASQIVGIGVKMGSGSGSKATYNGPVYVDEVEVIGR